METNPQLELAYDFLQYTGTNVFLTGKAGTGKTTFLRNLKIMSPKRMIVIAPTGVAAINAGGVTIHSFFQLPFGPYVVGDPTVETTESNGRAMTNKYSREKINIIRSLDLVVIDEISMVRADLLDAVSDVLRRFRDHTKPFGGVQILMIGDLQQLPPVVKDEDWNLLKSHYASPFFFNSKALRETSYVTIELTQIYRQSDLSFIELLNNIRDNQVDTQTLERLNRRYVPDFNPDDKEGYITLTTHNWQAQTINKRKLDAIKSKHYTYASVVDGNFPEYSYPTDEQLVLKKGAQVMFVKNDSAPAKRYYNGKIGVVVSIDSKTIQVRCSEKEEIITVEQEEWTNAKYTIDPETREITETIEGTFKQYPLKTAWAITIHKSQGLTFEHAIVDAASAFSHGQVYVALSRCKTLEGLVLNSPLNATAVINDREVQTFSKKAQESCPGKSELEEARKVYFRQMLSELFDYNPITRRFLYVTKLFTEHLATLYPELVKQYTQAKEPLRTELKEVGERFKAQLYHLTVTSDENDPTIRERVIKGVAYFKEKTNAIIMTLLQATDPEIDNKEIRKAVNEDRKSVV